MEIHPVLRSRVTYELTRNDASLEELVAMFSKNSEDEVRLAMLLVDPHIFTTYPDTDGESV